MNNIRRIDRIIQMNLPLITNGEETVETVLATYPKLASELRPRLEAALWLIQTKKVVQPRPGYISSSRGNLENKIKSLPPLNLWQRQIRRYTPQRWAFNLITPVITILLVGVIINSVILTARLSIPGETLYNTKLFIEDIQLALTINPVKKTDLYIQNSRERTNEIVELVLEGEYQYLAPAAERLDAEIRSSLSSLNNLPANDQTIEHSMIATYRDTLSNEIILLNVLKTTSPSSAHTGIEMAINAAQSGMRSLH
jgi:hypothetical protein